MSCAHTFTLHRRHVDTITELQSSCERLLTPFDYLFRLGDVERKKNDLEMHRFMAVLEVYECFIDLTVLKLIVVLYTCSPFTHEHVQQHRSRR